MKITFILPFVHPGGGVRIVFEHAYGLQERGHDVVIYYPGGGVSTPKAMAAHERVLRKAKYTVERKILQKKEEAWFGRPLPVERIPNLDARYIRTADLVIATSNESADWVVNYPERCGRKVYFIQDYETWSRDKALVDKTWKYPMAKVTISQWLMELGEKTFHEKMYGPVNNGLTNNLFFPDPLLDDADKPVDVLLVYRKAPQKGCDRALRILEQLKAKHPDLVFRFFGRDPAPELLTQLGDYVIDPPQQAIRRLYSEAKVLLLPSYQEGFAGPPLEAMACGCCVVATTVGGPIDYIKPGENGWLVDKDDDKALFDALEEAVTNSEKRQKLRRVAQHTVQEYTWDKATDHFESILQELLPHHG